MTSSTLQDRIKLALEKSGLSKTDLWKGCGVSSSTVSTWFNGRNQNINGGNLLKAAKVLGVHPLWLANGQGEMCPTNQVGNNVYIPSLNPLDKSQTIFELKINQSWLLKQFGKTTIDSLSHLNIVDDTMSPHLNPGDYVLIDTSASSYNTDGLYAVRISNKFYIRRIQHQDNGNLLMKCDNSVYENQTLNKDQSDKTIVGKALWSWNQKRIN